MRYIKALKLAPSEFKRMYGVTVETFWEMVKAVRDGKQGSRGSNASLPIPDQILLTLQYWREYRTYFHIAQDWGMHESTAQRTVKRIEDILIKSGKFGLPSRRKLWKDTAEIEVIAIDVASTEIERQKKNRKNITVGSNAEMLNLDTKLYIFRYSKTNQVNISTKHEFLKPMNKTNFLTHTSLNIANLI